LIELRKVVKTFGKAQAIYSLDLMIPSGKTTVLIGPSGCGKSTILRLVIGLIRPDSGSVKFQDITITPETAMSIRRRMGYVIQEGGLFPHLTAYDNIVLMARYLGWDSDRIQARIAELTDLTRFPPNNLVHYPLQLSGGQRQRVSLMRSLMLDPEVLLMDEPLGSLDPMIRADLQEDLKKIFRTLKKTVIFVTHDMGEACFFGDTIVLLHNGRVVQSGEPGELVNSPADPFVAQFINAQRSPLDALGRNIL
jgi:osmoprotectant transport system ATP-binding protein